MYRRKEVERLSQRGDQMKDRLDVRELAIQEMRGDVKDRR